VTDPSTIFTLSLVLLLALDLLATATQTAASKTNLARLLGQREQIQFKVDRTLALLNNSPKLQASLHLTQNFSRFLLAGLTLFLLIPSDRSLTTGLSAVVILILSGLALFVLEWIIVEIISGNPEYWILRLTSFARALVVVLTPLVALPLSFSQEANGVREGTGTVTEDELMTLVDAGQEEGVFEQGERRMIFSIFRLGDTLAREIMVPRIDLLALDVTTPLSEAVDVLLQSGYSRVPVYKESIDNIQGLLYAKDLLAVWRKGNQIESLENLLRPAYFVPETKKVDELLAEMQAQRIHMAIVVDEYGGVAGLVTLEDIVEEIVGEILDEYDKAEEMLYQVISDSEYVFQGRVDLDDFNEIVDSELPREEADTLGGFIYSRIGRVPTGGESIQVDNLELTVEQVSGRRIRKVRVLRLPQSYENGGEEINANG
jgi:CBS domain containing-hemolysin-like protein